MCLLLLMLHGDILRTDISVGLLPDDGIADMSMHACCAPSIVTPLHGCMGSGDSVIILRGSSFPFDDGELQRDASVAGMMPGVLLRCHHRDDMSAFSTATSASIMSMPATFQERLGHEAFRIGHGPNRAALSGAPTDDVLQLFGSQYLAKVDVCRERHRQAPLGLVRLCQQRAGVAWHGVVQLWGMARMHALAVCQTAQWHCVCCVGVRAGRLSPATWPVCAHAGAAACRGRPRRLGCRPGWSRRSWGKRRGP